MNKKLIYGLIIVGIILLIAGCIAISNQPKKNDPEGAGQNDPPQNDTSTSIKPSLSQQGDTSLCHPTKTIDGVTYKLKGIYGDLSNTSPPGTYNAVYVAAGHKEKIIPVTKQEADDYHKKCGY